MSIRMKKTNKRKKILFQVGLVVFLVFAVLIVLLGFLLVYGSRSAFFSGQQDYMKAQLLQVRMIIASDPMFEWTAEMWEKYPLEMRKDASKEDNKAAANTPYMADTVSPELIEKLKKEDLSLQLSVAKARTTEITSTMMLSMAMTGDQIILIDTRKDRMGTIYLMLPYDEYPTEELGMMLPEMMVTDEVKEKIASSKNKNDVIFTYDLVEDGKYYCAGFAPVYCHGEARYALAFYHEWTEYHSELNIMVHWMLGILVGVLAIGGALLLLFISTTTVGPVKRLRYGIRKYAKEKNPEQLRTDMEVVKSRNELEDLAVEITDMAEEVDRYMNDNIRLAGEREAAAAELSIATRVQQEQLPTEYPENPHFSLQAFIRPAREVGGDFYDFFLTDNNRLVILVADVSDKGMGAAFFMAISKAMIKACAMQDSDPVQVITKAESMLTENNPGGMFVTAWIAIIDLATGHVEACNAGHDYPAVRRNGKYLIEKTVHGPAVSFLPGVPHVGYGFDLVPGDRIFLYTDGVVEAIDQNKERFGMERIEETLNKAPAEATDAEIIDLVKTAVDSFAGEAPQFDDMTMMSFTYRG